MSDTKTEYRLALYGDNGLEFYAYEFEDTYHPTAATAEAAFKDRARAAATEHPDLSIWGRIQRGTWQTAVLGGIEFTDAEFDTTRQPEAHCRWVTGTAIITWEESKR